MADLKKCKFEVTVNEVKGKCNAGYEEGNSFIFDGIATPANFCGGAYHTLFPVLFALRFGANFPFEKEEGTAHSTCPDNGYVTFKVKRFYE